MILYIMTCILQIVSAEKIDQVSQEEIIKSIDSPPVEMKEVEDIEETEIITEKKESKKQNIGDVFKNLFSSFIGLFKSKPDKN